MKSASERRRRSPHFSGVARRGASIFLPALVPVVVPVLLIGACTVPGLVGGGFVAGAGATDPATQLVQTQHAIDQLAVHYFGATQTSQRLGRELVAIDRRIRVAAQRVRSSRADAAARAAFLYRSQGADYAFSLDSANAQEDARRVEFLSRANERNNAVIERYANAAADLRAARRSLEARKRDQQRALAAMRSQEQRLESELAIVQRAYRAELAARRADQLRANTTTALGPPRSSPPSSTSSSAGSGTTSGTTASTSATTTAPKQTRTDNGAHGDDAFLACVRQRESQGVYTAVNAAGYYGAYQFGQTTWNITASHGGRADLIGVRPDQASPADQDEMAWVLYQWQGAAPWGGHCP